MFALNWLSGFGFWVAYVAIGMVVCVLYTRLYAPNTYAFINGELKQDTDGDYMDAAGDHYISTVGLWTVLFLSFTGWPAVLAACIAIFIVKLFFTSVGNTFVGVLKSVAKSIPDVSITKKDK